MEYPSPMERRHADHRRQSRVPGHGRRPLHRLRCDDRREALGDADRHRRGRRGQRPTWSTACSMFRSRSAGAACSASPTAPPQLRSPGTVYTFALGGKAKLPEFVKYQTENLLEGVPYDQKTI